MKYVFFPVFVLSFFIAMTCLTSCEEKKLTEAEATVLIKDFMAKAPYRSVSMYLGMMTDDGYVPTYKKIADGKYLVFTESVFVKEANRNMPEIRATEEGKKILKCEKNRCTADVCKLEFSKITKLEETSRNATVEYLYDVKCEGDIYERFKALADRQFIKSETLKNTFTLAKENDIWKIIK